MLFLSLTNKHHCALGLGPQESSLNNFKCSQTVKIQTHFQRERPSPKQDFINLLFSGLAR